MSSVSQAWLKLCHSFYNSLCPRNDFLLSTVDVCHPNSSGHKAVRFVRSTYLYWDYNITKIIQFCGGWVVTYVDLTWNGPYEPMVEWQLAGENQSPLTKTCHSVHHKSHKNYPEIEPRPPYLETGD
jgi:hypothetical protein